MMLTAFPSHAANKGPSFRARETSRRKMKAVWPPLMRLGEKRTPKVGSTALLQHRLPQYRRMSEARDVSLPRLPVFIAPVQG